jgi:hypothetical protein
LEAVLSTLLAAAHDGASTIQTLYYGGGALGGGVTLFAIGRALRPAIRRRVHRWDRLDQLLGDPDATPPRPGVLERVEELGRLAAELVPNHGSSYRDEYRRDRDHQNAVNAALAQALGITLPEHPARERP